MIATLLFISIPVLVLLGLLVIAGGTGPKTPRRPS